MNDYDSEDKEQRETDIRIKYFYENEFRKISGKFDAQGLGARIEGALFRAYRDGYLSGPLENIKDHELLVTRNFGELSLVLFRKVVKYNDINAQNTILFVDQTIQDFNEFAVQRRDKDGKS